MMIKYSKINYYMLFCSNDFHQKKDYILCCINNTTDTYVVSDLKIN